MKRTLTLKTERLADLTNDELREVAGADATQLCSNAELCYPPRFVKSLCDGCMTGNYSIVC